MFSHLWKSFKYTIVGWALLLLSYCYNDIRIFMAFNAAAMVCFVISMILNYRTIKKGKKNV